MVPAVVVLSLAVAGCVSTSAPRGFLPDPSEAQTDAYGSWMDVLVARGAVDETMRGELIAIDDETTWILTQDGIQSFPTDSMLRGRLAVYDSRAGVVGGGAVLGTLSTISNGAFLVFTAPMWMIGGSVAASSQSRMPIHEIGEETPSMLAKFARFPAGLPQGLDLAMLRPKP